MQLLKKFTTLVGIVLLSISCNDSNKECSQSQSGEEYAKNEASPTIVHSANEFPNEWWQLHIEGNDTTVHPYKYIVVSNDTIFCYDDMDYDVRLICKDQKSNDKRIIEVIANDEKYCYEATLIDENCCRWKVPSYWYEEGNGIYTNDKSRYKTYNFGIDTIYQNIGIEKVEAKWWGAYEFMKTIYINDTEPKDTYDRYYRVFIDSALFVFENRHPYYDDLFSLYVFNESENRLQFTQGFNDGVPKDTCLEVLFDGEDYYVDCQFFTSDIPSLTKFSKKQVYREYIYFLRDKFKYQYAKKIPHRDGEYLELPFIERDEED
ncbi:MAG: hypothetical protein MJZ28_05615 [Paludibacteraceae bacterium]|nr:hypothetical protein [Paludibacteraceae bacterium]